MKGKCFDPTKGGEVTTNGPRESAAWGTCSTIATNSAEPFWLDTFCRRSPRCDVLLGVPVRRWYRHVLIIKDLDAKTVGRIECTSLEAGLSRIQVPPYEYEAEDVRYPSVEASLFLRKCDVPVAAVCICRSRGWTVDCAAFEVLNHGLVTVTAATGSLSGSRYDERCPRFSPPFRTAIKGALACAIPASLPPEIRLFLFALSYPRLGR